MNQTHARSTAVTAAQPTREAATDPAMAHQQPHSDNRAASRWGRRLAAGAGALALAATAACSSGGDDAPEADPQSLSSQSSAGSDAAPAPEESDMAGENTQRNTADGICATSNLDIKTDNMQGAAGSTVLDVVFTNTGSEECTLKGYPGVSLVTDNNGTQLGASAEREEAADSPAVQLQPGDSATASVSITQVGALDPEECRPKAADGIRVYPPEETHSAYIELKGLEGCTGEPKYMSVQPVRAAQ